MVYDEDSVTWSFVHNEYANDFNSVDDDMSTVVPDLEARDSANRNPYRTYLHRQFQPGDEINMNAQELRHFARRRQELAISEANEEARRRARDTECNWSTNSLAGSEGGHTVEYEMRIDWDREALDHHRGFVYKADHFTWTHRCGEHNCSWHWVSPTEVTVCQRCNSRYIYKYGIFNCTHRLVSDWWLDSPCDAWFYFCTVCKGFYSRKTHCCDRGCLDVYALKRDRLTRFQF